MEKMRVKERFINSQHDGLREEYVQVDLVVAVGVYDEIVVAVETLVAVFSSTLWMAITVFGVEFLVSSVLSQTMLIFH